MMMKWFISGLMAVLVLFAGCEGDSLERKNAVGHYIADQPVKIDDEGSILYVSPVDNGGYTEWGGLYQDANARASSNGWRNTRRIVDSLGAGDYAAYVCDTLSAYGYDDWYLPSREELDVIYQNKDEIGTLHDKFYWSSTEEDPQRAWGQYLDDGRQKNCLKYDLGHVRCVRRSEK